MHCRRAGEPWRREVPARSDALSTPQRDELATTVPGPNGSDHVTVNLAESPLTQIAARKGQARPPLSWGRPRWMQARGCAGTTSVPVSWPRLGIDWEQPISKGKASAARPQGLDTSEALLAARQRVEKGDHGGWPRTGGHPDRRMLFSQRLERVEAERGWPARSAKVVLKTALGALDRHYRPAHRLPFSKLLHWGSTDYRPRAARADQ